MGSGSRTRKTRFLRPVSMPFDYTHIGCLTRIELVFSEPQSDVLPLHYRHHILYSIYFNYTIFIIKLIFPNFEDNVILLYLTTNLFLFLL